MSLTLVQAVDYVQRTRGEAFAFVPWKRLNEAVGGGIYLIAFHERDPNDDDEADGVVVHYSAGRFHSSEGEEESYGLDELPEEARKAKYHAVRDSAGLLGLETQVALSELTKSVITAAS